MASRWRIPFGRWRLALLLFVLCGSAGAREAQPLVADPVMEARVMAIAAELRCLVCQNETLAASQSALALDLRKQIEHQLARGASPQQVRDYMVERYGQFVLFRPALNASTIALWLGPFAILVAALVAGFRTIRSNARTSSDVALSQAESERARRLLQASSGLP
ncbi:Cytochrome c-type biogenesis protein CcmH [Burkholderiales bacterium 8X]|nr:Cytochrome c-type biogenesis protein CcmH [Burkholderiales bacterium 8X]